MQAHPLSIIQLQAQALGMTHLVMEIAPPYKEGYQAAITKLREEHGITGLVTGDILDVCNGFMQGAVLGTGVALHTPLWGMDRQTLLGLVYHFGMDAIISCVDVTRLGSGATAADVANPALVALEPGSVALHESQNLESSEPAIQGGEEAGGSQEGGANARGGSGETASGGGGTSKPAAEDSSTGASKVSVCEPSAGAVLDPVGDLLGQSLSPALYAGIMPAYVVGRGMDECGERGEFHTWVMDAQLFVHGKVVLKGRVVEASGSHSYLVPTDVELVPKQSMS